MIHRQRLHLCLRLAHLPAYGADSRAHPGESPRAASQARLGTGRRQRLVPRMREAEAGGGADGSAGAMITAAIWIAWVISGITFLSDDKRPFVMVCLHGSLTTMAAALATIGVNQ
jgi:hypothetical protein